MKIKLAPGLAIKKSSINGKGCFATQKFARRRKIAEYTGERISEWEAMRRARGRRHLRICDIDGKWSLDGARGGNGTHYINHSCSPNAYMKTFYGRVIFFALRDIKAGEEITIDYEQTLCPILADVTAARPTVAAQLIKSETQVRTPGIVHVGKEANSA